MRTQEQIESYALDALPGAEQFRQVIGRGIDVSLEDSWTILGIKGSGKTTFAKRLFYELRKAYPGCRNYVLDSKQQGDFDGYTAYYVQSQEAPDMLREPGRVQIWQPPLDNLLEYDKWLERILKARKPAIVFIDELSSICGNSSRVYPLAYAKLLKQGRGLDISVISLTQEAAYIPRQTMGQLTHFVRFHLVDRYDKRTAANILQQPEPTEPSGTYGFYHKNVFKNGPTREFKSLESFFGTAA